MAWGIWTLVSSRGQCLGEDPRHDAAVAWWCASVLNVCRLGLWCVCACVPFGRSILLFSNTAEGGNGISIVGVLLAAAAACWLLPPFFALRQCLCVEEQTLQALLSARILVIQEREYVALHIWAPEGEVAPVAREERSVEVDEGHGQLAVAATHPARLPWAPRKEASSQRTVSL